MTGLVASRWSGEKITCHVMSCHHMERGALRLEVEGVNLG